MEASREYITQSPDPEEDSEQAELQALYQLWQAQDQAELRNHDRVAQRCRLVMFTSRSNGYGRAARRRDREVMLLIVDNKYAFVVKDGEIRHHKSRAHVAPDTLAMELLTHLPEPERTEEVLLAHVLALASKES